MKMIYGYN